MKRKVFIVGVDGGTWSILRPAMASGYMPHLQSLVDSGASGILTSTIPALTPPAWAAFQTGMTPGRTGIFNFAYWDKYKKKTYYVNSSALKRTIWQIAGAAAKKIALLNVPLTYPPQPINGYVVGGIMTPSLDSEFTYPPGLKAELLAAVPGYHIIQSEAARHYHSFENFTPFVEQMADIIDKRAQAAQFIIKKEPLDVFMVHFQASDVLQHFLWGYLDENHPLYEKEKCHYIYEKFYRLLDQKIHEIRQTFTENNTDDFITFIISDHGFQAHTKRFNLGNWLCREGYLKLNPRADHPPLLKRFSKKLRLGWFLGRLISPKKVAAVEKYLKLDVAPFNWQESRAFAMGRSSEGFIYLLDENPDARGRVAAEITEKLKQIQDPQARCPVVQNVHRKEILYRGDSLEHLPDLIIEPIPGYSFTGFYQKNEGLFHPVTSEADFHVGIHHRDGILIAAGAGITCRNDIHGNLWDMAPTILYVLQVPIERGMDGRVMEELFTAEFKNQNPVLQSDTFLPSADKGYADFSRADEKKIEQRLRDLGYM